MSELMKYGFLCAREKQVSDERQTQSFLSDTVNAWFCWDDQEHIFFFFFFWRKTSSHQDELR
jgi:hypothetical protein